LRWNGRTPSFATFAARFDAAVTEAKPRRRGAGEV
jgi:hypothetical protein